MVESEARELSEEVMLGAVLFGHEQMQIAIKAISELVREAGVQAWAWKPPVEDSALKNSSCKRNSVRSSPRPIVLKRRPPVRTAWPRSSEMAVGKHAAEGAPAGTKEKVQKIIGDIEYRTVRDRIIVR